MAVRFLPGPDEGVASPVRDRGDLAEVIDMRARLPRAASPHAEPSAPVAEPSAPAVGVPAPVAELSFGVRDAIAVPIADEIESSEPPQSQNAAAEDGVRLLARKARSSGELRRELLSLGHEPAQVDAVLLDFESSLYLDDLGLGRVLAEGLRARKRASRAQIRVKLRERLLPDRVVDEVLGELDDEEEDELLRTAAVDRARRLTGLDRQTAERRLLGFLARRGWSGERAVRIAREALEGSAARGTVRFR